MVRILLGAVLLLIAVSMTLMLAPISPVGTMGNSPDTVAVVSGKPITVFDVRQTYDRQTRGQSIPPVLQGLYMRQVLDQMIFTQALEAEAKRLGIRVTPEEQTARIRQLIPTAFVGGTWVGTERYATEVEERTGMSVGEFEGFVRQALLVEKFRELVTDGISVSPAEIQQKYRWQNEKVQIEYALIKPGDLAASIHPSDSELAAYFAKNRSHYQVPERRSARYALLDVSQLGQRVKISDAELQSYYNQHLSDYKVENRAHVEHILFKTIGKTDAEIAEIRQKAEKVLEQAKHGANFEDLAKKYSEDDNTKAKGGDLGWIVAGQTVPEFEHAAFSLPKGAISDLVQTPYGFDIIKVLDRQTAHTKSLDEVRASILATLTQQKVTALENDISDKMAAAVRQSNRQPIETIAKELDLETGVTPLVGVSDPVGNLGNSSELRETLFALHEGEVCAPIAIDRGYVILSVNQIVPAHQGTLAEVRDRVLADYRAEKSQELAHERAEALAARVKQGEPLDKAAKSLGLETKTTDPFSRTDQIPGLGTPRDLEAAFNMSVGQSSPATSLGGNWIVYQVKAKQGVDPQAFAKAEKGLEQQVLQEKQSLAFEAFRNSLEARMRKEGKLKINSEILKRLTNAS